MRTKRRFCILLSLLIIVSSFCVVSYATTVQYTITGQTMGKSYTDSVTCKTLVIISLTTSSNYAYGYLQCYIDGSWDDVPGYVATDDDRSFQLTPSELSDLMEPQSSFECRGKLAITVPVTTYKNYLLISAN